MPDDEWIVDGCCPVCFGPPTFPSMKYGDLIVVCHQCEAILEISTGTPRLMAQFEIDHLDPVETMRLFVKLSVIRHKQALAGITKTIQ